MPEAVETRLPRPELRTALLAPANMAPAFTKKLPFYPWWHKDSVEWRCLDAVGKLVEANIRNTAVGTYLESGGVYVEQVLTSFPATSDAEARFTVLESALGECTHDRGYVLYSTEAVYDLRIETRAAQHRDQLAMRLTGNLYSMGVRHPSKVSWSVVVTRTANHISLLTVQARRPEDAFVGTLLPALLRISLARLEAVTRGETPPPTRVPTRG